MKPLAVGAADSIVGMIPVGPVIPLANSAFIAPMVSLVCAIISLSMSGQMERPETWDLAALSFAMIASTAAEISATIWLKALRVRETMASRVLFQMLCGFLMPAVIFAREVSVLVTMS